MHTASDPKHPNNDWYEELCALAAIGELSGAEFDELQQHLTECGDCRELYAEFRRMTADDLGAVAVRDRVDQASEQDDSALDENELLKRFLERAKRERAAVPGLLDEQQGRLHTLVGLALIGDDHLGGPALVRQPLHDLLQLLLLLLELGNADGGGLRIVEIPIADGTGRHQDAEDR